VVSIRIVHTTADMPQDPQDLPPFALPKLRLSRGASESTTTFPEPSEMEPQPTNQSDLGRVVLPKLSLARNAPLSATTSFNLPSIDTESGLASIALHMLSLARGASHPATTSLERLETDAQSTSASNAFHGVLPRLRLARMQLIQQLCRPIRPKWTPRTQAQKLFLISPARKTPSTSRGNFCLFVLPRLKSATKKRQSSTSS
jgi:hypothetical protein